MKFLVTIKKLILNKWSIGISLSLIVFVFSSNIIISKYANNVFTDTTKTPKTEVALLLGTSRYTTLGNTNLYFKYRIQAVVALYNSKKIKTDSNSSTHRSWAYSSSVDDQDFNSSNYCMVAIR